MSPINRNHIKNNIFEIFDSLKNQKNYFLVDHPALIAGKTGIALFFYHFGKEFKSIEALDYCRQFLAESLEAIDKVDNNSLANGYVGIGWIFSYLRNEKFISKKEFLSIAEIDNIIDVSIEETFEIKQYDLFYGLIGIGMFVIEHPYYTRKKQTLEKIGRRILALEVKNIDGMMWLNYFSVSRTNENQNGCDLGLAHGVPSIIIFLCKLYEAGILKQELEKTVFRAVDWLIRQERIVRDPSQNEYSFIHKFIDKNVGGWSRLAWCYGDLCIAISLMHVFKTFHVQKYYDKAMIIGLRTLGRNYEQAGLFFDIEHQSVDGGLCHGVGGIALIFEKLFLATGKQEFSTYANYFLSFMFQNMDRRLPMAGHMKYKDDPVDKTVYMTADAGLLEGIAGTGLCYLSMLSGKQLGWEKIMLLDFNCEK